MVYKGRIDEYEDMGIPYATYLDINFDGRINARGGDDGGKSGLWEHDVTLEKDRLVLMQFTNLKDKNGKEIYEGDIIHNHWHGVGHKDIGKNWEVKFGEHATSGDYYASLAYGWYAKSERGDPQDREHELFSLPTDEEQGLEVIGNIYENPELLK